MKEFLKYTLATIVGILLLALIVGIFSLLTLTGLASMSSVSEPILSNSVMVIDLDGTLDERTVDNPFAEFMGSGSESLGLNDLLTSIKSAKENDDIKGIYLKVGGFAGGTPAMLQELRDALVDFKKDGKFIVSYADNYGQGAYYLCSTADSLLINPEGMVELAGMSLSTMYYKNLMDKIGVKAQVFKVGTYKSAVEPYILDDMSEPNREQLTVLSDEIWDEMLDDISKSRKISKENLDALVDSGLIFKDANYFVKNKIVDKLVFSDEISAVITNMMKGDKNEDGNYNETKFANVANVANNTPKSMSGDVVAVYYATGEIVQDESPTSFGSEEMIVGTEVVKDLKKLADDDDVKAVVLRVNSPGGSAFASEQIWHQVMNIKAKKPIVVSMGGYAASGGYYISCAADWIVAEPTTLTGSIGIFGMFPDASELMNDKLGLKVATVKTNEFADMGGYDRPFNEKESALLQGYINRGYDLFTKRCADGRGMSQDSIKVIGEGRVWTGVHAKKLGLVDQLGSLDDAIAVAKKKAKIEECTVMNYPAQKSFFEQLMDKSSESSIAEAQMKQNLGEFYDIYRAARDLQSKDRIQAALPYKLKFNL